MNKGRREEIAKTKQKRRVKESQGLNIHKVPFDKSKHLKQYKDTGTPCSCYMCSGESYSRKKKHKYAQEKEEE